MVEKQKMFRLYPQRGAATLTLLVKEAKARSKGKIAQLLTAVAAGANLLALCTVPYPVSAGVGRGPIHDERDRQDLVAAFLKKMSGEIALACASPRQCSCVRPGFGT